MEVGILISSLTKWLEILITARHSSTPFCDYAKTNHFDGVAFDWEYPVSDKHGGTADDYQNFKELRAQIQPLRWIIGGFNKASETPYAHNNWRKPMSFL